MAIGTPLPLGMPGFNGAGLFAKAGAGGGADNAIPLPSWYNIVRTAATANDSVSLPPPVPGGEPIMVTNKAAVNVMVFGARNGGVEDSIDDGAGVQVTTGSVVAQGDTVAFYPLVPQGGSTASPTAGQWLPRRIGA